MVGSDALLVCTSTTSSSQTFGCPACGMVPFGGSALNVFADKGSSSLVSAAREPPDTIGTP